MPSAAYFYHKKYTSQPFPLPVDGMFSGSLCLVSGSRFRASLFIAVHAAARSPVSVCFPICVLSHCKRPHIAR
ncbi:unknown [Prevotella sp. CAG:255]|nr:unknown [Prevotella sp. CAG:255]